IYVENAKTQNARRGMGKQFHDRPVARGKSSRRLACVLLPGQAQRERCGSALARKCFPSAVAFQSHGRPPLEGSWCVDKPSRDSCKIAQGCFSRLLLSSRTESRSCSSSL